MKLNNLQTVRFTIALFLMTTLLLVVSLCSIAQTSIAIAPNKMNVLYIGVDNPVSIAAYGTTDDKVTLSITGGGGTLSKVNTGNYIVRVSQLTDDCTIQVHVDGKLVGDSKFRVRSLPSPMATVGGFISGSKIPVNAFKRQVGLGIFLKDFPFETKYEVLGYTFTCDNDNGEIKTADTEGSVFSAEAKQYIEQYIKPGRIITIDNIRVKSPDGRVLKVPSLVYNIM